MADSEPDEELRAITAEALAREVPDVTRSAEGWVSAAAERMTDVTLEIVRGGCEHRHDDPVTVYARPTLQALGVTVRFEREYLVATAVPGCTQPEAGWVETMRLDGVSVAAIEACQRRIGALTLHERRRSS